MKLLYRKLLAIALSFVFLLVFVPSVSAKAANMQVTAPSAALLASPESKAAFAENMEILYNRSLAEGNILPLDQAEVDRLMEEAVYAQGDELDEIRESLAAYGVYMYNTPASDVAVASSDNSDVYMSAPTLYFTAQEYTWTVTCGGNWRNDNWDSTSSVGNIGNKDGFGVGYTNCTGAYNSSVVRSYASIKDQNNSNAKVTSNRSTGDGSKGFGFELQDSAIAGGSPRLYVGYRWYGSCTYSAGFTSMGGIATAYYIHTYSTAEIQSVTFGVTGNEAGVQTEIRNVAYSFTAYSSDTRIQSS